MKKKVLLGISGGVDSSVAAYLLKKKGYEVIGGFILIAPEGVADYFRKNKKRSCPWSLDLRYSRQVASELKIPFYQFDFSDYYQKEVLDNFVNEYRRGRTPNPDVLCNRQIKFGHFLRIAKIVGADLVATGHYAQIKNGLISKGADQRKDQSYFLWMLGKQQIKHILFPLGKYTKQQVRKIARQAGLSTSQRPDSQGICFLGQIKVTDYLSQSLADLPGKITNEQGEILGQHHGLWRYTIGQKIAGLNFKNTSYAGSDIPTLYVLAKKLTTNTLIVGEKFSPQLFTKKVSIQSVNNLALKQKIPYQCQIRYGQKPQKCAVVKTRSGIQVTFEKPQRAVCPGQSLVIYQNEKIVGGGIIR